MKYTISIRENLSRLVVIEASSEEEAVEKAENLCNNGGINLTAEDFSERYIELIRTATEGDIQQQEVF